MGLVVFQCRHRCRLSPECVCCTFSVRCITIFTTQADFFQAFAVFFFFIIILCSGTVDDCCSSQWSHCVRICAQHVCGVPPLHTRKCLRHEGIERNKKNAKHRTDYHSSRRPNGNWIRNEVVIFHLCWFRFFGSGKKFVASKNAKRFGLHCRERHKLRQLCRVALKANIALHRCPSAFWENEIGKEAEIKFASTTETIANIFHANENAPHSWKSLELINRCEICFILSHDEEWENANRQSQYCDEFGQFVSTGRRSISEISCAFV